ncbi:cupredoxin domain-containing protein [Alicyclobacillus fodiniaquatilis]|uniref:Cupredoxin domain-containing protein n=1 Tax=Alicyclobacillus fodiniaquatilis TaxID=1661150 RepID=A0ABW4JEM1_9BACL
MRVLTLCASVLIGSFALAPFTVSAATVQVVLQDGSIQPANIQAEFRQEFHAVVQNNGTRIHNFVVPDFYVFTQNLQPGQKVDVRFTPDKKGSFRYYSDKNGVPEPGMEGHLHIR